MKLLKEVVDQTLHFGIAGGVSYLLGPVGAVAVVIGAEIRELWQHGWSVKNQGPGSRRDMMFWVLGAVAGLLV